MLTPLTRRLPLYLTVMVLLAAVYMVTYTGRVETGDELQYYDAAGTLARFGETKTGVSAWQFMPNVFGEQGSTPLRKTIAEPAFIYASALLVALADTIDGLGLAHTAWLFNILMTPLVCAVFFALAVTMGFSRRAALLSALELGVLTILWPYSSRFFREQLMMVFLLLTALALEHWRKHPRRVWLMLGGVGFFVLAYLTKEAAVLALPALASLILLPPNVWRSARARRVSAGGMIITLAIPLLMVYTPLMDWIPPVPLFGFYRLEPDFTRIALHTYLFSIGGSVWGTSPILLLGLLGAPLLMREGRHRVVWLAVLMLLGYAVGYGLLRGEEWFGGVIWPQRFLMPVIPFVMLLTVPLFERLTQAPRRPRALLILVGVLALYSLWWQLMGVGFRWDAYGNATFELSGGGLLYWSGGFNDLRYLRPVVLSGLMGQQPFNAAWVRAGLLWPPIAFVGLALVALVTMRALESSRAARAMAYVLPLVLVALMFGAVRALYDSDPLYQARPELHAMVQILRERAPTETPIFINDPEYGMFFYNYGKVGRTRLITLPYHPGDRGSCEQPLQIESRNAAALLAPQSAQVVHYVAERHPRMGLLMFDAPETPCIVRPLERFMGERYYRVGEIRTDPSVRLIDYATTSAPDPDGLFDPQVTHPLTFTLPNGDTLRLIGFTLPRGETYQAGDALPLSLRFEAVAPTGREFTVAWYVADPNGRVWVEGENTWPAATFKPTSALVAGELFWDNRAVFLPSDLPAGTYQVWVRLYSSDPSSGAITLADVDGAGVETIGDGDMAVFPVAITVNAR